ncbi:FAD binding domain-containing protein [Rhodocollybia butyracea]|uniref:FAD binding domain-containing protein n=1 Tax=Rhodocollybia butyracea TaxID=206335 RepID=A0A9P5PDJ8_9AGAR|nr:FAD binding domain-containing protein [Rhodocollybia butyracea]
MSSNRVNVLIAGAGPVGLVSALLFLRDGLSVRIITKEMEFRTGYRGPGIMPRTLELYRFLGVLDEIWQASGPVQDMHQYTSPDNGEPPLIAYNGKVEEIKPTPDKPYFAPRIIGQVDHEAILRSFLFKDYGCQVELGTELVSYECSPDSDSIVSATMLKTQLGEDKSTKTEVAHFDWLIGAEGAHSVHTKIWGDISKKAVILRPYLSSHSAQHSTPTEVRVDTRTQIMIAGQEFDFEELTKISRDRDALIELFYRYSGRTDYKFGELVGAGIWRPNIRMVDSFGKGRVYIAGDAAHVHSPTGGQGLNSGIQDVFNLVWKISLVHKKFAPHSLLESYTIERVRVIAAMLGKTTTLFKQTFQSQHKIGTINWPTRGFELRMFGINYRGSPIVLDEVQPPAEVLDPYKISPTSLRKGTITSLFDILKTTAHTALVFTGILGFQTSQALLQALGRYPSEILRVLVIYPSSQSSVVGGAQVDFDELLDTREQAYYTYLRGVNLEEASPGVVVLVRPDGHVGAIVRDVDGIERYFRNLLS